MRVTCSISSVPFSVDHFPGSFYSIKVEHPIFSVPQKTLVASLGKWAAGELTEIDSYLLYLALLKSTDLVHFRVPAIRTEFTNSIVYQHMESLVHSVTRLNAVQNPSVHFPHYVISQETRNLHTTHYWIENWNEHYTEYQRGARKTSAHDLSKLNRRESALERLIRNPHREVSQYANLLAEWAANAGSFPDYFTTSRFTSQSCTLSEYWQQIIVKAASNSSVYQINQVDLEELMEHCETNLVGYMGGYHYHKLMEVLRKAQDVLKNFLGLGDINLPLKGSGGGWKLINPATTTVEAANLQAAILNAPTTKPKREDYPSIGAFIKAKLCYDASLKYGNSSNES